AAHLALLAFGVTLDQAQAEGWMFAPQLQVALMSPWHSDMLVRFPWHALPSLFGDLLSVMFVAAITMLLNTSAVELATQREANLDRELNSHGIANLLIAAVGGVHRHYLSESNGGELFGRRDQLSLRDYGRLGCGSRRRRQSELSRLRAQMRAGRSPVLPWRQSALSVAGRFGAPAPPLLEYLSLLAIALIIVLWGVVAGLLLGGVIGCASFAPSASRIPAIKFSFDGSEYHSSLDRGHEEFRVLFDHGDELQGMRLQGYLFFGSASRLHEHIKCLLAARPRCRFLLFDFRL